MRGGGIFGATRGGGELNCQDFLRVDHPPGQFVSGCVEFAEKGERTAFGVKVASFAGDADLGVVFGEERLLAMPGLRALRAVRREEVRVVMIHRVAAALVCGVALEVFAAGAAANGGVGVLRRGHGGDVPLT
jgi:hypothetical protein